MPISAASVFCCTIPSTFFFDQVSFTYAYLGDLFQPNFFARAGRMTQGNYRQYMIRKAFGKRVDASADLTDTRGIQTVHEAAFVKIPEAKLVNAVRVEAISGCGCHIRQLRILERQWFCYHRLQEDPQAIRSGCRPRQSRLELRCVHPSEDCRHPRLLAERRRYNTGQHWFVRPTVHFTKDFAGSFFYSRMFNYSYDADGYLWNRTNLQVGVSYNFTDLFHRSMIRN